MRSRGTNPRTPAQVAVRSNLGKGSTLYKGMSGGAGHELEGLRADLHFTDKKSGRKCVPSVIQAFDQVAAKFAQISPGVSVPMVLPTGVFVGNNMTITATAGTGRVNFTSSATNAARVETELMVQVLKSTNRMPTAKGYRRKAFFAFATGALSSTVTLPIGSYAVGYIFVETATGHEKAFVPLTILTVALSVEDGGLAEAPKTVPQRAKKAA